MRSSGRSFSALVNDDCGGTRASGQKEVVRRIAKDHATGGDQSRLMVHLLTRATCWFDFRQKQRFFFFSMYSQTEDTFSMCKCCLHNCILRQAVRDLSTTFQMSKCGLKVTQTTTTVRFDDRYVIGFKN